MKKILFIIVIMISFAGGYSLSAYLNFRKQNGLSLSLSILAVQEFEDRKYAKSLQYLSTALYFDRDNKLAHHLLATTFYRLGLYQFALEEFTKYLESPKDPVYKKLGGNRPYVDVALAYCYIADINDRQSNQQVAIKNYESALNQYPDLPKYLSAYIKVISEKAQKTDDDIKQMQLYSTFLSKLQSIKKEG